MYSLVENNKKVCNKFIGMAITKAKQAKDLDEINWRLT